MTSNKLQLYDVASALAEGWFMSADMDVQRDDRHPLFESDEAVLFFIRGRASRGSAWHAATLADLQRGFRFLTKEGRSACGIVVASDASTVTVRWPRGLTQRYALKDLKNTTYGDTRCLRKNARPIL